MIRMFLLAIAGGLGCGFGLVFLIESTDSRVRDVETLRNLGIDVLAVIPNISDPVEVKRTFMKDVLLFGFSGVYLLCFVGVFVYEVFF